MVLFQLFLAVLIAVLEYGPLGQVGLSGVSLGLGVVATWAFTWFVDQRTGLTWAVILGCFFELISFLMFGSWLATFIGVCLLTDLLKSRFFEVGSMPLALLTLGSASVLAAIILGLSARSFDWFSIVVGIISNIVLGLAVYYFLGLRFRFFARWRGRRL